MKKILIITIFLISRVSLADCNYDNETTNADKIVKDFMFEDCSRDILKSSTPPYDICKDGCHKKYVSSEKDDKTIQDELSAKFFEAGFSSIKKLIYSLTEDLAALNGTILDSTGEIAKTCSLEMIIPKGCLGKNNTNLDLNRKRFDELKDFSRFSLVNLTAKSKSDYNPNSKGYPLAKVSCITHGQFKNVYNKQNSPKIVKILKKIKAKGMDSLRKSEHHLLKSNPKLSTILQDPILSSDFLSNIENSLISGSLEQQLGSTKNEELFQKALLEKCKKSSQLIKSFACADKNINMSYTDDKYFAGIASKEAESILETNEYISYRCREKTIDSDFDVSNFQVEIGTFINPRYSDPNDTITRYLNNMFIDTAEKIGDFLCPVSPLEQLIAKSKKLNCSNVLSTEKNRKCRAITAYLDIYGPKKNESGEYLANEDGSYKLKEQKNSNEFYSAFVGNKEDMSEEAYQSLKRVGIVAKARPIPQPKKMVTEVPDSPTDPTPQTKTTSTEPKSAKAKTRNSANQAQGNIFSNIDNQSQSSAIQQPYTQPVQAYTDHAQSYYDTPEYKSQSESMQKVQRELIEKLKDINSKQKSNSVDKTTRAANLKQAKEQVRRRSGMTENEFNQITSGIDTHFDNYEADVEASSPIISSSDQSYSGPQQYSAPNPGSSNRPSYRTPEAQSDRKNQDMKKDYIAQQRNIAKHGTAAGESSETALTTGGVNGVQSTDERSPASVPVANTEFFVLNNDQVITKVLDGFSGESNKEVILTDPTNKKFRLKVTYNSIDDSIVITKMGDDKITKSKEYIEFLKTTENKIALQRNATLEDLKSKLHAPFKEAKN